jgi:1-acyl-sn-glycerol-3-phosphate acyltransferase
MTSLRKLYRILHFGILLIAGAALTIIFLRGTIPPHGLVSKIVTGWLGRAARAFGVRIKSYGTPLPQKTLFVSNHISWLDILVLGHLVPIHFLSKEEVRTMPLFGWLATRAGTLYIKRGNKRSASESSSEITAALNLYHNSLIFAEGTTSNGNIKKFHGRMMQSAIDAHAMVQPVAIFYPLKDTETGRIEVNPDVLYIDEMNMGESFDRISRARCIDVEVHFLKPINSTGKTRDEIAQHAFDEVVQAIKKIKNK